MKRYHKIILYVIICLLFGGVLTDKYMKFRVMKNTDVFFIQNAYQMYLDWYFEFPDSQDLFKRFTIQYAFDMGKSINFIENNPLLDNTITFTRYTDSIPSIRATLSIRPKSEQDLIENAVTLEEFNFIHYLMNSKAIILFDYPAYKCNGSRSLMVFHVTEPNRCFDEIAIKITRILKGFYKGHNELIDLAQGSKSACYHIRATKQESTFAFSIECLPQDSTWIDQKGLDLLMDTLESSFAIPELEYVDHFFFPLIAKNTTLQQEIISKQTNEEK